MHSSAHIILNVFLFRNKLWLLELDLLWPSIPHRYWSNRRW